MEKLLRPKDKILLGLAFLGDFYFEIAEPLSVQLGKLKGALPPNYKTTNFYNTLYRSLATGEIKKVIKKGQAYYQLGALGKKRLIRKFPLIKLQKKKWDGWWRILIFDIAEDNKFIRNSLRRKLHELGFGMWQESVYLTPYNIAEEMRDFLVAHNLRNEACLLVAKQLFAGDVKKLVAKIWNLEELNKQYEELIDDWEWAISPAAKLSKAELKKQARKSYAEYLEIIAQDPFLPKELLPADWWAKEARELIKQWFTYFD